MIQQASNLSPNRTAFDFSIVNQEGNRYKTPFSFNIGGSSQIFGFAVEIYDNSDNSKVYDSGIIEEGSISDENGRAYSAFSNEVFIKPLSSGGTPIAITPSNNRGNSIRVNLYLEVDESLVNNENYNWVLKQYYKKNTDNTIDTSVFVRNTNTFFVSRNPVSINLKAYSLKASGEKIPATWDILDGSISTKGRTLYIEGEYTDLDFSGVPIEYSNHIINTIRWRTVQVLDNGETTIDDTGYVVTSSISYKFDNFLPYEEENNVRYKIILDIDFSFGESIYKVFFTDEGGRHTIPDNEIFVSSGYEASKSFDWINLRATVENKYNRVKIEWDARGIPGTYYNSSNTPLSINQIRHQFDTSSYDYEGVERTTLGINILEGDRVEYRDFEISGDNIFFVRMSNILNLSNYKALTFKVDEDLYSLEVEDFKYALYRNEETSPLAKIDEKIANYWNLNLLAITINPTINPNNYLTLVTSFRKVGQYVGNIYIGDYNTPYSDTNIVLYPGEEDLYPDNRYYILPSEELAEAPLIDLGSASQVFTQITLYKGFYDYLGLFKFKEEDLSDLLNIYNTKLLPIWKSENSDGELSWDDFDTSFLNNLEYSLESGELSIGKEPIDSWYIERTSSDTGITEKVGVIDTLKDVVYDYIVPNNWKGTYSLTPVSVSSLSSPVYANGEKTIETGWWNYSLIFLNKPDETGTRKVETVFYWDANTSSGEHSTNTEFSVQSTLGNYKKVSKNNINIISGKLDTLMGYLEVKDNKTYYVGDTAISIKKLRELMSGDYTKVIKDKQGNLYPIEFTSDLKFSYSDNIRNKTYVNGREVYASPTQISIQWIEVEESDLTGIQI